MQEPIERNSVPHIVAHKRASISRFEFVRMDPKPVRTACLFIHKMVWRFPRGDFAAPSNGKTADAQPVIDDCANVHFNRLARDGPKLTHGGVMESRLAASEKKANTSLIGRASQISLLKW